MSREKTSPSNRQSFMTGRAAKLALAVLLVVLLSLLGVAIAQEDPAQETSTESTTESSETRRPVRLWVEVTDERGRPPADVSAGDLDILEDGNARELLAVRPATQPTRVVLYLDRALSSGAGMRRAAEALAANAEALTDRGEVDLVVAGDVAASVLKTDDALFLGERLDWTAINDPGEGRILEIRSQVLDELRRLAVLGNAQPEELARIVLDGIAEERVLIRERQELLTAFLANLPQEGPRLALVISDGFDLDPTSFYTDVLEEDVLRLVAAESLRGGNLQAEAEQNAAALSALGWTVVPVSVAGSALADDVRTGIIESGGLNDERTTGVGVTIRPGSIFKRRREEAQREAAEASGEAARLMAPRAPLQILADASGGQLMTSQSALSDFLERYGRRYELFYTSELADDAGVVPLEIRGRNGLRILASRFVSPGVPEEIAGLRLRQILRGLPSAGGELDVAAVLEMLGTEGGATGSATTRGGGALEARLQLQDLFDDVRPANAAFRVTVGLSRGAAGAVDEFEVLSREVRTDEDLRGREEWTYRTSLAIPDDAADVAVIVEDVASGRWGGTRASVTSRMAGTDDLIQTPILELVRPDAEVLRGRIRFETKIFDRDVARVVFQLNDRDVAEADRAPFAARIDLGRSPRRQTLAAVAFGPDGEEMGRDTVVLNAGSGGLAVEILQPDANPGSGPVDFEANVAIPLERQLDRVIFFWNNEALSTLYAPPFRQRVVIPEESPVGYVRVVAMLDDGTVAEDVFFVNGPRSAGERIDVNLVELYVVVTDEANRPVRGLTQENFLVREEGRTQAIASFSDAADLPLTLGMAIDSSASMFVKLPNVQRAAIDFLRSTFSEQDRAFVVDFDTTPRLVRSTTHEVERVVLSIENMEANGRTALWESIVYSLVQLQGVRGRKALIVFSDGADEDDEFPFRSCLSFAKKMGVPIYLILMRKEPKDPSALSLLARSFNSRADRLVASTGGRIFYAKEFESLDAVYDEIEVELRSQYLLTYYPEGSRGVAWRDVDVSLTIKGLEPRTLSGYWP